MKGKRIATVFLCLLAVAAVAAACVLVPRFLGRAGEPQESAVSGVTVEALPLSGDPVELTYHRGLVRVDSIRAGLDTYSFEAFLYDPLAERVLSRVTLPEGTWERGCTDCGFYAADMHGHEVHIYDSDGSSRKMTVAPGETRPLLFCALSAQERYFAFSVDGVQLTVQDLTKGSQWVLSLESPLREARTFEGAALHAVTVDGQLLTVDVESGESRLLVEDQRITDFSADYGLGRTDFNFLVADEDACKYIPFTLVGEVVVSLQEHGFVTAALQKSGDVLRVYDLSQRRVSVYRANGTVTAACPLEDGRLLAVVGSAQETQQLRLYTAEDSRALAVYSSDRVEMPAVEDTAADCEPSPEAVLLENVPLIHQFPRFPTGCESVSAVMALQYAGESVSVDAFIDNYLPRSSHFYMTDGIRYGPSPYEYFIGDPRSSASYGCMAPVIHRALTAYFGATERVKDTTGTSLDALCEQYIDKGTPVLVWATIKMLETNPVNTWYMADGQRFAWPGNEHCMLLVGYDNEYYYFNDPYAGDLVRYTRQRTEDRYAELGWQSLVILKD